VKKGHIFKEGDGVCITSLKKDGVVHSTLGSDTYRVAIGSLIVTCRESDLTPSHSPRSSNTPATSRPPAATYPRPPRSLDLHGLTVDEAIRKLDAWLDSVILSDLSHVKVVHGLGTGRVQRAVHERLNAFTAVRRFALNQWNAGETDVYL
jgi:DNA mismatch repair protein MutS2